MIDNISNMEYILRIIIAAILGGAIGLEREYRAKEAGFRTHFLVGLGSALFMVISQYGFGDALNAFHTSFDPSRIASQVVTGIGFIGAGTIIFQKHMVKGLTTAAGLWVTSAIGLTAGAWHVYAVGHGYHTGAVVPGTDECHLEKIWYQANRNHVLLAHKRPH